MTIDWGSLVLAAVISAGVTLGVVSLVAFAVVGLSARAHRPIGGRDDGAPPPVRPAVGAAIAAVCVVAVALIVGYGLFLVVT
ncbi:hypothetical protein [Pseudonocardia cypriaca]|uniref:Uncharacterized protein n=1 Tax=Pseudonocardia cypriaca TaxID=882449 RepID=A0A543GFQ3_9PSEU|nr:hypothetical protein [Pseudonocardia cypriaca]TQM44895.1 hypothetical protein FB388_2282 [Pseudonocardia cypriaca]